MWETFKDEQRSAEAVYNIAEHANDRHIRDLSMHQYLSTLKSVDFGTASFIHQLFDPAETFVTDTVDKAYFLLDYFQNKQRCAEISSVPSRFNASYPWSSKCQIAPVDVNAPIGYTSRRTWSELSSTTTQFV